MPGPQHPHVCSLAVWGRMQYSGPHYFCKDSLRAGTTPRGPQGGSLPAVLPSFCSGARTQPLKASIACGSGLNPREAEQISVHKEDRSKKHLLVGLSSGAHT